MIVYYEAVIEQSELNNVLKLIGEIVFFNKCHYRVFSVESDHLKISNTYKIKVGFEPCVFSQNEFNEKYENNKNVYMHSLPWDV